MSSRPVSVVFYLPKRELDTFDEKEALPSIGVRDVIWKEPHRVSAKWSLFQAVDIDFIEFDTHHGIVMQFSGRVFWDLRGDAEDRDMKLDDDPALPLVVDFLKSCVELNTEVGFICTRYDVRHDDWLRRHSLPILMKQAWHLLDDVAVLYLAPDAREGYEPDATTDHLVGDNRGLVVFSGTGRRRWL